MARGCRINAVRWRVEGAGSALKRQTGRRPETKLETGGEMDPAMKEKVEYYRASLARTTPFFERILDLTGKTPEELTTGDWIDLFLFQGWSDEGPIGGTGGRG